MITLREITLQRGTEILLDHTDLTIQPGRCAGIVGQNGCGKSSLFQLLLGQLHQDGGELSVPPHWRVAHMAQEVGTSDRPAVEYVLDGDAELRRIEGLIADAQASDDHDALAHAYGELEIIHGYDAHYRAEQLLHGLGFRQDQVNLPTSSFSGGWRIRLNLAQALMSPSELLLLDEPTNHLDLDATLWLEQWLKEYPGTLLIISHDRDFLDNIVDEIVHFENRKTFLYSGNYSSFERQRAERLALQQAMFVKQQQRIAEIESFVRRFRAKATKAKQAQSRLKELDRMEKIAPAHVDSPFHFSFKEPERQSTPLIKLTEVNAGYGDTPILSNIQLLLQPGTRIGLLGMNGAGKSTLIKTLVGSLAPIGGEVVRGEHLKIGYFAQHQLEALDMKASVVTHIQRISPRASEQDIRNFVGGFNFHGDKALEPITPFSGGEKARLALALVVWQRPNLLLLDEPTNHLDLEMRYALTVALQSYTGALIVISHDRYLLRNTIDEYYLVHGGKVEEFDGTLEDYQQWLKKEAVAPTSVPQDSITEFTGAPKLKVDRKAQRQEAAAKRQQTAAARKQLQTTEKNMAQTSKLLKDIELELADPAIYNAENKAHLQQLLKTQKDQKQLLSSLEETWLALTEQLDSE